MKKVFIYFLTLVFPEFYLSVFAQNEAATKFFSSVPQLISDYPSPGNPCENAIEFTINTNEKSPINLRADNTRDSKGKAKVKLPEGGNKIIWYKVVFNTDCELTFRIYSDKAEDTYHYFVYRQTEEKDFCRRLSEKRVIPIRANMLEHREGIIGTGISDGIKINYKDTTEFYFKRILLHTPFLDGIRGKAGETYYINIYHMGGTDAFHYLVLSACYREINLKTENENSGKKAEIIEKLPEHVTKPSSEKSQAEKDSLAAMEKDKEAKKKADAAEKKIAEAKAKQKASEEAKRRQKPGGLLSEPVGRVKKISPQLVNFDEKDTLNQYLIEGKVIYTKGPMGPVVEAEIYVANSDGSITVLKKMYSNDSGNFRFANLPLDHNYQLSLNPNDPNLKLENEPVISGIMLLKGEPAEGLLINNSVKTAADGSFTLNPPEVFSITANELFSRWSIDLSDPADYSEMIKKYGGISIDGLVYRVQIGAYREEENFNYSFMNDLGKVDKQSLTDGITRFVMGEFNTLKEADTFKQKALERKVNDAFILAYFNGNKKYLEELIEKKMLEKQ